MTRLRRADQEHSIPELGTQDSDIDSVKSESRFELVEGTSNGMRLTEKTSPHSTSSKVTASQFSEAGIRPDLITPSVI